MKNELPDLFALVGLVSLVAGIFIMFGSGWALIIAGALMITMGMLATWRRARQ